MKRTHQALVVVAAGLLAVSLGSSAASAAPARCKGSLRSWRRRAMKNSAKAKLGDSVRIGKVRERCEQKGLLYECTAFARACR
jgi:hypothetical protein